MGDLGHYLMTPTTDDQTWRSGSTRQTTVALSVFVAASRMSLDDRKAYKHSEDLVARSPGGQGSEWDSIARSLATMVMWITTLANLIIRPLKSTHHTFN